LKCRALTGEKFIDDTDLEEQGIADELMDDNSTASMPRPGTSIQRPGTSLQQTNLTMRPASHAGRPMSGFVRPSTQQRNGPPSSRGENLTTRNKPGSSRRPMTALGRQVRLGTASMVAEGVFIDVEGLDMRKYASEPDIARALCEYIVYHEHNPRKALELCALATQSCKFEDWWWKHRLAKCYYTLGLFREAEQQFRSILRTTPIVDVYLELGKVYLRLDQPKNALDIYEAGLEVCGQSTALSIAMARTYDMLMDESNALLLYKKVLSLDPSNVEATACLGAHYFYGGQPEIALRFYRRLLSFTQSSSSNHASAELWNNVGLCCFYSSQYDMALPCFHNALASAADSTMSDIWYNIGHVAVGVGDLGLAYQCFKVVISIDPTHAEALNNIGVLEVRKGNSNDAAADFATARKGDDKVFEPCYNGALLAYKKGNFAASFELTSKSLEIYPDHEDSKQLMKNLKSLLAAQ